jgi:hypothetical protein
MSYPSGNAIAIALESKTLKFMLGARRHRVCAPANRPGMLMLVD